MPNSAREKSTHNDSPDVKTAVFTMATAMEVKSTQADYQEDSTDDSTSTFAIPASVEVKPTGNESANNSTTIFTLSATSPHRQRISSSLASYNPRRLQNSAQANLRDRMEALWAIDDGLLPLLSSFRGIPGATVRRMSMSTPEGCEICYSENDVQQLRECERCHARTCLSCFRSWLNVRIQFGTAHNLTCAACPHPLSDTEIRDICGERAFRRCAYFRSRFALRADPDAVWCPVDGCWALLKDAVRDTPRFARSLCCPDCQSVLCRTCMALDHPDTPCTIPTSTLAGRARARAWQAFHTKKCPICSVRIERAGGCSQMRCASCHTKFCWRCRGVLYVNDRSSSSFDPPSRNRRFSSHHGCICPRIHSTMSWVTFTGTVIILAPFVLTAAAIAAPPALVIYIVLPKNRKRFVRRQVITFFRRI